MSRVPGFALGLVGIVMSSLAACDSEESKTRGSCTVKSNADGSATIVCDDGTEATIPAAVPGVIGEQGATGPVGATGALGPAGETGAKGDTGAPGPAGETGAKGDTGAPGPSGETGAMGDTGAPGPAGETGAKGDTGAPGPAGETGAKGDAGATGDQGVPGTSCSIVATVDSRKVVCGDGTQATLGRPTSNKRNVVIIVGDGMQLAHEVATSRYLYGTDRALSFHQIDEQAFVTTWDVSTYNSFAAVSGVAQYARLTFDAKIGYDSSQGGIAPYPLVAESATLRNYFLPTGESGFATDSASAATAMSTGHKTDYGNIAWISGDPSNGSLETSAERLRKLYGMAIGVVSTAPFSHATPAAWLSHNKSRDAFHEIAHEIVAVTKPDVVIGGGFRGATDAYVAESDVNVLKSSDEYVYVEQVNGVDGAVTLENAAATAVSNHKKLFALFGSAGGNFPSPVPVNAPGAPGVVRGSIEAPLLKDASVAALEVLAQNPNGFLLIVEQGDIDWANHANDFSRMIGCVWDLEQAVGAVVQYVEREGDDIDWSNTTIIVTADHGNGYLRFGETTLGAGALPQQIAPASSSTRFTYPNSEVTYGTSGHTNELVTFYAKGAYAHRWRAYANIVSGRLIIDNTAIFLLTLDAATR